MGQLNKDVPNYVENTENLTPVSNVVNDFGNTSDSDDEELAYAEYEPLPTDEYNIVDINNSDEEDSHANYTSLANGNDEATGVTSSSVCASLPSTTSNHGYQDEVWSKPTPKELDIEMDSAKIDEVKEVMKNVTLPQSSVPDWASNIPEDLWKEHLIHKLRTTNK